jgi:hypothetical protein
MYYQRITSLFRGFSSLKQIFCQVAGQNSFAHHHNSPYIDYFSINCVPQLAKKGGGGV